MKIIGSAPGKLILFGEHASSRNRPAIVFAVNKRLKATLTKHTDKQKNILLSSRELGIKDAIYPDEQFDLVSKAIEIFLKKTNCSKERILISFESEIESGFGSSAAVIASTLGVLNEYYRTNLSNVELLELGLDANFAIKGYGSGLDIAAAVYGGMIKYQIGKEPIQLPYKHLNLVIGNTGIKAISGPIVKSVKMFENKNPHDAFEIFNSMERIVIQAENLLKNYKVNNLGVLMDKNQELLQKLNVSSPKLEEMITAAKKSGALGAKLSGAGIGDNMIVLTTKSKRTKIIKALNQTSGKALPDIEIDPNGLVVDIEE
ncbi:MAG: mevalonate kinase [Asgard group archaeon]|nr:mevalonate kinase [Asgard group archaeon]